MDSTYTDMLEQAKNNAAVDVRVSMPARIISFDKATKTAQVQILMQMVDNEDNPMDYPPLSDCPCKFIRGGGFHVVHPYKEGDEGIVLFADRCLDGWFESGNAAPPMDYRIHSMSDAYFIGAADSTGNVSPIIDDAIFIGKDDNSAGLQINGDGTVVVKGAMLTVEPPSMTNGITNIGTVQSNGDFSTNGDVTASGISLKNHKHGGVQSGGSDTGVAK